MLVKLFYLMKLTSSEFHRVKYESKYEAQTLKDLVNFKNIELKLNLLFLMF